MVAHFRENQESDSREELPVMGVDGLHHPLCLFWSLCGHPLGKCYGTPDEHRHHVVAVRPPPGVYALMAPPQPKIQVVGKPLNPLDLLEQELKSLVGIESLKCRDDCE